ncbi:hypothetical protein EV43_15450, partial [Staphylococcus aureus]
MPVGSAPVSIFSGVEAFFSKIPGNKHWGGGKAYGSSHKVDGAGDRSAECGTHHFGDRLFTIPDILKYFFEIIDPYSVTPP